MAIFCSGFTNNIILPLVTSGDLTHGLGRWPAVQIGRSIFEEISIVVAISLSGKARSKNKLFSTSASRVQWQWCVCRPMHSVRIEPSCPFAVSLFRIALLLLRTEVSLFRSLVVSHRPFVVSPFRTFVVSYVRCFTLSLFCTFVVSPLCCFVHSLFHTFIVSHFRCFVHSLSRTFIVSYFEFVVSHFRCFVLSLFRTFVASYFLCLVLWIRCFVLSLFRSMMWWLTLPVTPRFTVQQRPWFYV